MVFLGALTMWVFLNLLQRWNASNDVLVEKKKFNITLIIVDFI